jgi:hypothetical protein
MKELNCPHGYRQQQDRFFYPLCMLCCRFRKWTTSQDNVHQYKNRKNYQLLLLAASNLRGNKLNKNTLRNSLRSLFFIARVTGSCLAFWCTDLLDFKAISQTVNRRFISSLISGYGLRFKLRLHTCTHAHTRTDSFTSLLVFLQSRWGLLGCWTVWNYFKANERTWMNK